MRMAVYCIQCTVDSGQWTGYSLQSTVYSLKSTMYSVQCTVYSVQCTVYTVQFTVYRKYQMVVLVISGGRAAGQQGLLT